MGTGPSTAAIARALSRAIRRWLSSRPAAIASTTSSGSWLGSSRRNGVVAQFFERPGGDLDQGRALVAGAEAGEHVGTQLLVISAAADVEQLVGDLLEGHGARRIGSQAGMSPAAMSLSSLTSARS